MTSSACWVCGSRSLKLAKKGDLRGALDSDAVKITDARYGCTADIYRCEDCGFLECPNLHEALSLYEGMDDEDYEKTRAERALQARRLLGTLGRLLPSGKLLDVGAGSGILVNEARELGYDAIGIEPSAPLQRRAASHNLPILHGVLPHANIEGPFDAVILNDVIEHVSDPVGLLREAARLMHADGICAVVTPDVSSIAARLLGWRWWHFRTAHIGYFNKRTLMRAASQAGLKPVRLMRPTWYFSARYLLIRLLSYLPPVLRFPVSPLFDRIVLPLNLFDSLLIFFSQDERIVPGAPMPGDGSGHPLSRIDLAQDAA